MSRINWGVVQPGDTILIDGGPVACPALGPGYNCGMVYNSSLSVGASGTSSAPITIRLASEAGRNGTAIIDGGITAWSRCAEYPSEPTPPSTPGGAGVRETGINLNATQWVVIDGTKWGGIEVRNHTRYGVNLASSQRVTLRYLKIHHNTDPANAANGAVGITQNYQSQYNTVARVEIFRNGQDALRGAGDYFTLAESYIHDQYCNHPDGVQSFVPTSNSDVPDDAGEVRGLVVRRNVFERIGMQSVFLGENVTHQSWNVDVAITDNLFLFNDYTIKSKHGRSSNWLISNNTVYQSRNFAVEWCCASPGARAPMTISNNIFVQVKEGNTAFYLPTGNGATTFSNNCLYRTGSRSGQITESGTINADPLFANPAGGDFALRAGSPCAGKGSAITSVQQLVATTAGSGAVSLPTATNTAVLPTSTPGASSQTPATPVSTTGTATSTPVTPTRTEVAPTGTPGTPTRTMTAPTSTRLPAATPTQTRTAAAPTNTAPAATATASPVAPSTGLTTLTFAPSADTYVDAGQPSANYGGSEILRTYGSPEQRSYLRFAVQGIAGRGVSRVLLRLYANGGSEAGFAVHTVSGSDWSEMGLRYTAMPALGQVIAYSGDHGGGRWVSVDLTGLIRQDGAYSLALTTTSAKPISYPSRNAPANQPQLVLELSAAGTSAALPLRVFFPLVGR